MLKFKFSSKKIQTQFFIVLALFTIIIFINFVYLTIQISFFQKSLESITFLDRNGQFLYEKQIPQKGYSNFLEIEDMNQDFIDTMIIMEDKRFYYHPGIDPIRMTKCLSHILDPLKDVCGASTITQQYVKLTLNHDRRTLLNKIQEIFVSIGVDLFLSKKEILERYLNTIYFSNLRYGVESASNGLFGKDNQDLDLAQISFLSAIPNSPKKLDPYKNFLEVKERQKLILTEMAKEGIIEEKEIESIYSQDVGLKNNYANIYAPHFVTAIDELGVILKPNKDGIVYTSVDLDLHNKTVGIINDHMEKLEEYDASNASVVILDAKTGEILNMVGSKDFFATDIDGQVNTALSLQNPGSTLKPFTYALALSQNFTLATQIEDREQIIYDSKGDPYFPQNYDKNEHGFVSVRDALANSFNIPAVMTMKHVGVENFYDLMDSLGLEEVRDQRADVAATLGGCSVSLLELSNAYRIFPNEGYYPGGYSFIKDEINEEGNTKVFNESANEIAFLISDVLGDNNARRYSFGSLSLLNLPFDAYVKTGTTQDFKDSWTIGYTQNFIVGVWVGNNDNSEMDGINGISGAAKIWNEVMQVVQGYYELNRNVYTSSIDKPLGIEEKEICSDTGEIYSDKCETFAIKELFIENKTPEDEGVIIKQGIIDPDGIGIINPYDKDEYVFQEDFEIPIQFLSNSKMDRYSLLVNGEEYQQITEGNKFMWKMSTGNYQFQVLGVSEEEEKEILTEIIEINVIN